MKEIIIDLGCGINKVKGSIGVDANTEVKPDIIHDLNSFPYPFTNNFADKIYLDNTLEHLENTIKVMDEVYRILKLNAMCIISVPYFRSKYAFCDPTHKKFFTLESFRYFDKDDDVFKTYKYSKSKFKIYKVEFNKDIKKNFFVNFLCKFAIKHKWFYESFLSHLFPLSEVTFYLKKDQ